MTRHSNKSAAPALREVVIFSIIGVGYICAVWLLFEKRIFLACASVVVSLLAATLVEKSWRLNRLRRLVKPRHQHGLPASGHRPRLNPAIHPTDRPQTEDGTPAHGHIQNHEKTTARSYQTDDPSP